MLRHLNRRLVGYQVLVRNYVQASTAGATGTTTQEPKDIHAALKEKLLNDPEQLGWHQSWVPAKELQGANKEQQKIVFKDEFQHDW
jgi:hypothetical protein